MGTPRIRDVVTFVTTLPASVVITCCLFLPHTTNCHGNAVAPPVESGTWIAIVPLVALGLLPFVWYCSRRLRRVLPEIVLGFTLLVLGLFVVTLPVAIYLMWGYSKRSFRDELLVAMCGVLCVALWLFVYPLVAIFGGWLPAGEWTYGAALVELVGLVVWGARSPSRDPLG